MQNITHYNFNLQDAHCIMYNYSTPEFEKVRTECLSEDNWLRKNYTKESLIIEEHLGYGVVYKTSTGEPMVMGGLYYDPCYPPNTARMLNRTYIFPKFRSASLSGLALAYSICHQHLIFPLITRNNFDCYFITMQNREKPSRGWWKIWKTAMATASDNYWNDGVGYVQTKGINVQKCWQNFVYHEITPGSFTMPTILHDKWEMLDEGI